MANYGYGWLPHGCGWLNMATDGFNMATDGLNMAEDGLYMATDGFYMATDGLKKIDISLRLIGQYFGFDYFESALRVTELRMVGVKRGGNVMK